MHRERTLTGDERHRSQLLPPLVRDLDRLDGLRLRFRRVALRLGVLDELLDVVGVDCVYNIPEVLSVGHSPLWQLAGKEPHDFPIFLHHRPKRGHSQLVVERHVHAVDFIKRHELLLFFEDFFEEVFVHHVLRRQVQLHYTREIKRWLCTYSCHGSSG